MSSKRHRSFPERYQWRRPTNDHCFSSKFGSNRLGLPPFSRTSAKKYLLYSQLATSETRRELEPKLNPKLFLGTRRSAIGRFFSPVPSNSSRRLRESQLDPVSFSFLKWRVNALHSSNEIPPSPPPLPSPTKKYNLVPRVLSYPSLRRENLGTRLPKTLLFESKPFNRKIRLQFQMQQTFPATKFPNFEYSYLSRMFVFAEISEEEEETFHSLDEIFGILNRSFLLNSTNP